MIDKHNTFKDLVNENRRLRKENKRLSKQQSAILLGIEKASATMEQKSNDYFTSLTMPSNEKDDGFQSGVNESICEFENAISLALKPK